MAASSPRRDADACPPGGREAGRDRSRQRRRAGQGRSPRPETVFELKDLAVTYGGSYAVQGVDMLDPQELRLTALIGPSGLRQVRRVTALPATARTT